ncbi:MAG: PCRF domain-containing protein [Patescibacteria group bacterium]
MSDELKTKIVALEAQMQGADFWADKEKAQAVVKEYQELKDELESGGAGKYDKLNAIITIFAGAGGDDAEDWARMLFEMYRKFVETNGFGLVPLAENQNDQGGYRNISFKISTKNAYGLLKNESGVHRLVRISPFNAGGKRQTSFALVEVIPEFTNPKTIAIPDDDLKIEFTRSSGPGGQNVNKRETAVRITHWPTGLVASSGVERTQEANRRLALVLLEGKIYKKTADDRHKSAQGMYVSKTTDNEWGSQIRSYVLHPYKMVKDHRTNFETSSAEAVLAGDIEGFLQAEQTL